MAARLLNKGVCLQVTQTEKAASVDSSSLSASSNTASSLSILFAVKVYISVIKGEI